MTRTLSPTPYDTDVLIVGAALLVGFAVPALVGRAAWLTVTLMLSAVYAHVVRAGEPLIKAAPALVVGSLAGWVALAA